MKALAAAFNKSIAQEFSARLRRPPPAPQWTPEQSAFIEAVADPARGSIFGEAVAGSGKTTVLIAAALRAAPSRSWTCKTMHGLGYAAWQAKIGRHFTVNADKTAQIIRDLQLDLGDDFGDFLRLIGAAKNSGLIPAGSGIPRGVSLVPDAEETWDDLISFHDLDVPPDAPHLARKVLRESILRGQKGEVDFDDMLYLPVCFRGVFTRYPLVLVDEAQDLSLIQHEMLKRTLVRTSARLIACGDRHQAIYAFRGALSDSVKRLISTFDMELLPLTVSFRCSKAVVREAQRFVPHIQPHAEAPEGTVTWELPARLPECILCRNTAPLVDLALHLIASGNPAVIAGRDIGKSLQATLRKALQFRTLRDFKKAKPVALPATKAKLDAWIESQIARKPRREEALRDRQAALHAIIAHAEEVLPRPDSHSVHDIIERLYGRDASGAIHLSTIHRAKGLEWREVLILNPHLMPSKYATQPWQLEQERNLHYVAITRAKERLYYATEDTLQEAF